MVDTHELRLPSGEVLTLNQSLRMIFEADSVDRVITDGQMLK